MPNPASIRLGTTGKAQVKADFAEIAQSGAASFARIGDAGDAQAKRWGKAYDSASRDAEAAMVRLSTARTKLDLLMPGLNPTKLDAYAGVTEKVGKAAAESGSVFEAAFARMDHAAAALIAKHDPLVAAQQRFDEELARAKVLFDAGSLSAERYERIQRSLTATLDDQRRSADERVVAVQRASAAMLETAAGVRPATPAKGAADSGAVFEQYFERMDQRARALVSAFDPLISAQQRYDEGLREARQLLDAGSLSSENYERVQRSLTATLNDQRRAADDRAAAIQRASAATLEGAAGVRSGSPTNSAAESASVFEDYYAKLEQRTRALVAAIDPAFAAQERFNREMAEARELVSAGTLSLDQYAAKLRLEREALDAVGGVAKRTGNAFAAAAPQIQDLFVQVSMGGNPINALVVQGGQLAGQLQYAGGKAEQFANILMGPWGIAAQAALLLLSPMLGKMLEFGDATEQAIDKLKEDAKQSEIAARAKDAFAKSVDGVEASIREQAAALDKAADSEKTAAQRAVDLARENYKLEMSTRAKTAALLEAAIAQERIDRTRATAPGQRGENAALSLDVSSSRVASLQDQLAQQQRLIETARRNLLGAGVALTAENVRRDADPVAAINARYKAKADAAEAAARAAAKAGRDTRAALEAELNSIEKNRAAAVKAEQDKQQASRQTANQIGRNVTLAEARQIAESIGGHVTSDVRSRAEQQRLYDRYMAYKNGTGPWAALAAKPGTSNHESGQALDIAKSGGVTLAKIIAAYKQAGVSLSEALDEGSHYHIAFRKTGEAARQATEERKDAAKAAREAAAAERELEGDLRDIVQAYDPARAAADDYSATLAKIDALVRGGKLTVDQANTYRSAAFYAERKRQADEGFETFKRLFGSDDPMAAAVDSGLRNIGQRAADWAEQDAAKVRLVSAALDEMRGFGADFVETVLSPDTWSSWGNAGRTILGGLQSEFLKLALLNPLKNLINGDKALPTLSSAIGNIGKLFTRTPGVGANASGTEYWSGGMSLVGENGPEIVSMPRGARVTPAADTRRMLAGNDNAPSFRIDASIHAPGADAAALARVEAAQRELIDTLPAQVIAVYADARQRGIIRQ